MNSDIDIGVVKPLVSRAEILFGRTSNNNRGGAAGKPAYKSQEEQYQEIQDLKRTLGEIREEHSTLKARNRRLEEDLLRRDRQIDQLMDPAKVVRLRNKLNIAQQQHQRVVVHNAQLPNAKAPRDLREGVRHNNIGGLGMLGYIEGSGVVDMSGRQRAGGDGQESPTANLRHTIVRLEEENARLCNQLSTSNTEKDKLSTDLERVLGLSEDSKANYESLSRLELIHELEYRHSEVGRLEAQQKHLTEVLSRRNDHSGDNNSILQARMAELQSRELEWERERASLRELINTLKDDRIFYKETAQKKDSDLDALRTEVTSLQQEVISLHESDKKRRDRQRHTPSPMQQRTSRGTYGSSRSGSSSEANTPTHRPRPSSAARPPAPRTTRTKAQSEPRDITERQKRSIDNKRPPSTTRPPSRPPSSASSSPKKTPIHSRSSQMSTSLTGNLGNTSTGVRRSSSSSVSSPTKGRLASPYGSPRKAAAGTASRSTPPLSRSNPSSPSKVPTPLASPRKTPVPQSPARSITPRSSMSSKSSSPYSSVNSSPAKTVSNRNKSNQSPVKSRVPQLKSDSSPSKTSSSTGSRTDPNRSSRRKDEKISSPRASQKSSRHRSSTKESSLDSYESDLVLAELIFQNDTDTTSDSISQPERLERQRTITLSVHGSLEGSEINASNEGSMEGSALMRQNTVTLSRSEHSSMEAHSTDVAHDISTAEGVASNIAATDADLDASLIEKELVDVSLIEKELVDKDEKDVDESMKKSISEMSESNTSESTDQEIIDNLELLRSLLSSHLSRQQQVNDLLSQEPLLMGDVQY